RTITITDNGMGMTYEELVNNLGTIAKSGTLEFLQSLKDKQAASADLIGQFGVGFYSAFMVSSKVVVESKSPYSEKAYRWISEGEDTFTIEECDKVSRGTEITLHLRKDEDEEKYSTYLDDWQLGHLVKKYSDYVKYPIRMDREKSVPKKDAEGKEIEGKFDTVVERETLNQMTPIWNKNKSELKDDELDQFYKTQYADYDAPAFTVWTDVEGAITYKSIVYVPAKAPYNLYSEKYEKGLQLYAKGVFVMDKCKELVPDYLRFVKGLVVSPDLSLNISREILQHDRQLKKIAQNLEKKILAEFEKALKNDREKYEKFWGEFGVNLKYGVYDQFGEKKDLLKDLILFSTANQEKRVTLREYVEKMPEGQKEIYFASAPNKNQVRVMPQMDILKKKGYDVLVLSDDVDEFMIQILHEYDKHEFKSINQGDLDLLDEQEKEAIKSKEDESRDLLAAIQDVLKDEVKEVKLSTRLSDSPVCLVSGEGLSFEMEKVISQMPGDKEMKADKILEINPNHPLFQAIGKVHAKGGDLLSDFAWILYDQALLIEGIAVKDPVGFAEKMVRLMIKAAE
ncbi:MAG: molecular chaperone HtpG, partial [Candidatus Izemoplasmatales bacterium]